MSKCITTRPFEIRLVVLGVSDPGENLVGEDLISQFSNFRLDFPGNIAREED